MRKNTKKPFVKREEADQHRINEKITAREIRLVIEGEEPKVMSTSEAIRMAEEEELDLVEISPNAVPPVCKIMDYRKFLEEGSKVKAYVFFRGRTIVFKDRGEILLLKFAQELADIGAVEQLPKLEGKRMIIMINPKKK